MAYFAIEPWGEGPEYLRAGIISSTIANAHRRKNSRPFRPEDFMPKEPTISKPKKQTVAEMKIAMQQIAKWAKEKGLTKKKKKGK